jgi:chemotaxis protein MotB
MSLRSVFLLLCAAPLFLGSTGCATRYQDLLRDRDAEIRDLQGKLANSRSENEDLRRQLNDSRVVQAAPASAGDGELATAQNALPELDIRRNRGRISIGIENTITFDSGSAALKASASSVLGRVADLLRREYPGRRIYVEGHTDTDPINKTRGQFRTNRHLSTERADAVATWLIEKGSLPVQQIAVVGYGPYDPRETGSGDQVKAKNRRVEIVVGEDI